MYAVEELVAMAMRMRERAYAPYSDYRVGAVVESTSGLLYTGCNVENVSYGLTICAERAAIVNMVASGENALRRIVVATQDGGLPCGMCLQTIREFTSDATQVEIVVAKPTGVQFSKALSEFLPFAFNSPAVHRT